MTEPITCEARLMGLSKTRRKDGDWVEIKFHIHPDDHPAALFILPLGTDCNLAISGVAESEEPDEPGTEPTPAPPKGGPLARQAGILCATPAFQQWIAQRLPQIWRSVCEDSGPTTGSLEPLAAEAVRNYLRIGSRSAIDHCDETAIVWKELTDAYYELQRGDTLEAREQQRDRA